MLRIATRESPLAMWQAHYVASQLSAIGIATSIVPLVSGGDIDMRPIDGTRQVGVFTKRIQQALVNDEADVAVHSLKDLPTAPDERFVLAAVPERETVEDSLVTLDGKSLAELPANSRVGTGSTRRMAQLNGLRSDLEILPIRGNVQTRLGKLKSGEFDAIILAEAGVLRLEMNDLPRVQFSLEEMLPAPGQGALGIEVRSDDEEAKTALAHLDDRSARLSVTAERTVLAALHGGCLAPIAVHGHTEISDTGSFHLRVRALVMSPDGSQRFEETDSCDIDDLNSTRQAEQLGEAIADKLRSAGADKVIAAQRQPPIN